jgi:hypothetical protein
MDIVRTVPLLATLVLGGPALAQQQECPQGQLRAADGSCIAATGPKAGRPGGGTANIEAAKGGTAAEPNKADAPVDKDRLGPKAVGPDTDGQRGGSGQGQ